MVGDSTNPLLEVIGAKSFQIRCNFTSGNDASTS